ncbi:MAG TPA: acetate--CoA ligase family protein [Spirochaetota bacterium]|nr:acetate--CoA ligase family protein [Spirochaetota bacterium]HPI88005.1 acetate--CoA ligase family protein [Spirochaetota bacterium]HPR46715.1 acetate--CoA ligase family protein [Spirochaetota bacterium]
MSVNPLQKLMNPGSIAIVGAGNNPMKMGTMHALSILKNGYQGKLYCVHPKEETVLGTRAYKTVADIPEVPDLAFIVVPSSHLPSLMEDFGKKGTRHAVVITAGFKETGADGRQQEELLNSIADKYGIRFIGPNCMGIINSQISLNTTVARLETSPGLLGLASQSGTYVTQVLPYLKERGIRFSKAISVGNEANINIIDALEYLGDDEDTRAISLYIEGIRDVRRFLDVARKITPRKPVLAQYIGGTEAGARAGMSHTGALAGPDHLYEGLFRQAGIIRVHSVEDLYGLGWALATQPRLKGNRVGIITNSGGPGSTVANTCELGGMTIPRFSDELQARLKPLIPPHAPAGNPVDLTFNLEMNIITEKIPRAIMESGEVDGIVLHGAMSSGFVKAIYLHIKELAGNAPLDLLLKTMGPKSFDYALLPRDLGVPMTVSSWFQDRDDYTEGYQLNDVPTYDSPEKAARAMVSLYQYKKISERAPYDPAALPRVNSEAASIIEEARRRGQKALDEYSAKRLLSLYGIPVCAERLAASADEARAAAESLGYPVAVKVCDHSIMHKTEGGMVFLNVGDAEGVARAFSSIREKAGRDVSVLVSSMVSGQREFLAGIVRQKGFAPCVVFGLGGILTEALNDTAFRVAPLTLSEAGEMLDDLRTRKVLGEFRKMPPVNRDKTAGLLQRLSFIPLLHPEIAEIDMNPIMYRGADPVVVDALIVLEQ